MHRFFYSCVILLVLSCAKTPAPSNTQKPQSTNALSENMQEPANTEDKPATSEPATSPPVCETASTWRYERIELPPEFAPTLPKGVEILWFAPGMFDSESSEFWTYTFSLQIDKETISETEIKTLLQSYYEGLIGAVAEGRKIEIDTSALVSLSKENEKKFNANISLHDAFVTGKKLDLNMKIDLLPYYKKTCIIAMASPMPYEHEVWQGLQKAKQCLPCKKN